MDEIPIVADSSERVFKQVAAHYDAPAFARRALRVERALEELFERCRVQRAEWLEIVRARFVAACAASAIDGDKYGRLAAALDVTTTPEKRPFNRRALAALAECIARFNRRWVHFLRTIDLSGINCLLEDYNRYYVLEKECALRSPKLARAGFVPLPRLTHDDLAGRFPGLPEL